MDMRTILVNKLNEIPQIGVVNAYQRYADKHAALREFYVANGVLCGWFVHRFSVKQKALNLATLKEEQTWQVRGYRAFDDANASAIHFEGLVDGIREKLRTSQLDPTGALGLVDALEGEAENVEITDAGPIVFAGILCHTAIATIIVRRFVPRN